MLLKQLLLKQLLLCDRFDINKPLPDWSDGRPVLVAAASQGMCDLVELALDNGAQIDAVGEYGSVVGQAALAGRLQVLDLLYRRGADISAGSAHECMIAAAARGHVNILKRLLKLGVDVNHTEGDVPATALFIAAMSGQLAAARFLLDAGAVLPRGTVQLLSALCIALDDEPAASMVALLLPHFPDDESADPIADAAAVFKIVL